VTELLAASRRGDDAAVARLFALVYPELREIARRHVRGTRADGAHGATSLVHEVFLRLAKGGGLPYGDRAHFFAAASRAMRRIVVDDARTRSAQKRGGGAAEATLDEGLAAAAPAGGASPEELLALDAALAELGEGEPRRARTVEWHFFGGLTFGEIAEAQGLTERTVLRDWRAARALLHARLGDRVPDSALDARA
jgi:RNA polymerase sigma factor (TIGR02999 family)